MALDKKKEAKKEEKEVAISIQNLYKSYGKK